MKAITIPEPGDADALVLADVPAPEPGPGEVLVDRRRRRGQPRRPAAAPGLLRPAAGRLAVPRPGVQRHGRRRRRRGRGLGGRRRGVRAARPAAATPSRSPSRPGSCCRCRRASSCVDAAALPEVACTVWSNVFMIAEPAAGRDAAGARRLQRHRHDGDPARPRGRRPRRGHRRQRRRSSRRCRELGAEVLVNYREQDFVEVRARARPTGPAPTWSSTTWARSTSPATSTRSPPTAGWSSSACRAAPRPSSTSGALLRKRAAVIATSLRARPAGGEGGHRRGRARARLAAGRRRAGAPDRARHLPAGGRRRGPPRAGGQRAHRQGAAHPLTGAAGARGTSSSNGCRPGKDPPFEGSRPRTPSVA